jgi:signal peptidase I
MVNRPRNLLVTAILSALAPGVGHLHRGRVVPGIAFAFGNVVLATLGALVLAAGPGVASPLLVVALGALALWIAAVVDSVRGGEAVPPGDFNRWYVCVLLGLLSLTGAANWALAVRKEVVQVFHVPSGSMRPTLPLGAHVLVNEMAYRKGPVRRGDVVVFVIPNERYQRYVKRVVALPGDTVEVRGDDLFLNGAKLAQTPASEENVRFETNGDARYPIVVEPPREDSPTTRTPGPVKVPNGHCFVLGDNRNHSVDSRDVGPVPLADVVGRVDRVF